MKTSLRPRRDRGNLILTLVVILCIAGIAYLGYRMVQCLKKINPTNTQGGGTNDPDALISTELAGILALDPEATVTIPAINLTLPIAYASSNWYYRVDTSVDLKNWVETDLDWAEALEQIKTNRNEPCRFYRQTLIW